MITGQDRDDFTRGCCFILADVLAGMTGFQRAFTYGYGSMGAHAFVQLPDGRYLDINGPHDEWDLRLAWELPRDAEICETGDFRNWTLPRRYNFRGGLDGFRYRAEELAPELLELAGVPAPAQAGRRGENMNAQGKITG